MENVIIPDQTSNAGPEDRESGYDWRDYLDFAGDEITYASRAMRATGKISEARNAERIKRIDAAVANLEKAKELLCR